MASNCEPCVIKPRRSPGIRSSRPRSTSVHRSGLDVQITSPPAGTILRASCAAGARPSGSITCTECSRLRVQVVPLALITRSRVAASAVASSATTSL